MIMNFHQISDLSTCGYKNTLAFNNVNREGIKITKWNTHQQNDV
jgi:hypothetical protein